MTAMAIQPAPTQRKRALVLMASGASRGWFCEACSWNHPLPADVEERAQLARHIRKLFDEHSCQETSSPEPGASAEPTL